MLTTLFAPLAAETQQVGKLQRFALVLLSPEFAE